MASALGWGWPAECVEYDAPLDLDELVGVDLVAEPSRGRRGGPGEGGRSYRTQVCKHWLRGLCMKGDRCDYLHVYDPARTPICHLFATHGECNNKDCIFAHRAVDERSDECPYYNRGFCSKGAACRQAHVRRQPCPLYLQGFCPDGPACEYGHPRFELPDLDAQAEPRALEQPRTGRSTEHVTCYKCWRKGHYAQACGAKRLPQPPPHLLRQSCI
ncbi:hypothetical protein KFE25_014181 [Diacronema lutheri]|uniref:Cleavage and polyadenylation specificity factor subunit 4 n=2 Tax=Diacronema lutheri TaxID=2081491 RepID=A0A8J5X7D1_DIALT|nr:hypothetical protein KFE25_014181 [Diacronema lutheri]